MQLKSLSFNYCVPQKRAIFYLALFVFFVLFDQFFKHLFSNSPILVCNKGISLGLTISPIFFWLIWLIIITLIFKISNTYPHTLIIKTLILSGAISNIIDRFYLGCVRDFIPFLNLFYFNFADLFIVIGFLFFIYFYIKK